MKHTKKLTANERCLVRRYLIWCYKTTKEDLDRIDRYFTQLRVDHYVLAELSRAGELQNQAVAGECLKKVNEFQQYIEEKAEKVFPQKFVDAKREQVQPEYWYLQARFSAIERAIIFFLGKKELTQIHALYEDEMTQRILTAREHP